MGKNRSEMIRCMTYSNLIIVFFISYRIETSNLLYNAGTLLLYRPLLFNHGTTIALMGTTSNQLLSVCTTAARSIVDIFEKVPVWGAPFMKDL